MNKSISFFLLKEGDSIYVNEEKQIGYYAVIPSTVLFNENLKANEASSKYNAKFIDFIQNIIAVRKLNIGEFYEKKITENSNEYLKATKANERKRSSSNWAFTGLMDLLYLVILIVAIMMTSKDEDALPYLLFFITALGKLYSTLNSLVRLIDISERFKTAKK